MIILAAREPGKCSLLGVHVHCPYSLGVGLLRVKQKKKKELNKEDGFSGRERGICHSPGPSLRSRLVKEPLEG